MRPTGLGHCRWPPGRALERAGSLHAPGRARPAGGPDGLRLRQIAAVAGLAADTAGSRLEAYEGG